MQILNNTVNSVGGFPNINNLKTTTKKTTSEKNHICSSRCSNHCSHGHNHGIIPDGIIPDWVTNPIPDLDIGQINLENYFNGFLDGFLEPNMELMTFLKSLIKHKISLLDESDWSKKYIGFGHISFKASRKSKNHIAVMGSYLLFKLENLRDDLENEINRVISEWKGRRLVINNISTAHTLFTQEEYDKAIEENGISSSLRGKYVQYHDCILLECDKNSFEDQYKVIFDILPSRTGIKTFTIIYSGGKSLHILIRFNHKISLKDFDNLKEVISKIVISDPSLEKDLVYDAPNIASRIRVAGVPRFNKGEKAGYRTLATITDKTQDLVHICEKTYGYNEIYNKLSRLKETVAVKKPFYEDNDVKITKSVGNILKDDTNKDSDLNAFRESVEMVRQIYAPNVKYGKHSICPACYRRTSKKELRASMNYNGKIYCLSTECEYYGGFSLLAQARRDGYLLEHERIRKNKTINGDVNVHKYNQALFDKGFEDRVDIRVDSDFMGQIRLSDYKLTILQCHCGSGKTTGVNCMYHLDGWLFVIRCPYNSIKEQKYLKIIKNPELVREEYHLVNIFDETIIQKAIDNIKNGRVYIVCPEGFHKVEDEINEKLAENPNLKILGIDDEAHNNMLVSDYRPSYLTYLEKMRDLGAKMIFLSATIQPELPELLINIFNVHKTDLLWERIVTNKTQDLNLKIAKIANNTEIQALLFLCISIIRNPANKDKKFLIRLDKALKISEIEGLMHEHCKASFGSVWAKRLRSDNRPEFIDDLINLKNLINQITICTSSLGEGADIFNKLEATYNITSWQGASSTVESIEQFAYRGRNGCKNHYVIFCQIKDSTKVVDPNSLTRLKERIYANKGIAIFDETSDLLAKSKLINKDGTIKTYSNICYIHNIAQKSWLKNDHCRPLLLKSRNINILSTEVWDKEYYATELAKLDALESEERLLIQAQITKELKQKKKDLQDKLDKERRDLVMKMIIFIAPESIYTIKELADFDFTEDDWNEMNKKIDVLHKRCNVIRLQFNGILTRYLWKCYKWDISFDEQKFYKIIEYNKLLPIKFRKFISNKCYAIGKRASNDKNCTIKTMKKNIVQGCFIEQLTTKYKDFGKNIANDLVGSFQQDIENVVFSIKTQNVDTFKTINENNKKSHKKDNIIVNREECKKFKRAVCMLDTYVDEITPQYTPIAELNPIIDKLHDNRITDIANTTAGHFYSSIYKISDYNLVATAKNICKKAKSFIGKTYVSVSKYLNKALVKVKNNIGNYETIPLSVKELRNMTLYQCSTPSP